MENIVNFIVAYSFIGIITASVQALANESGDGFFFKVIFWPLDAVRGLWRSFKIWRNI